MNSWVEYIKKIWKVPALLALFTALYTGVLFLYDLPLEPILYGAVLCTAAGAAAFFYGHHRFRKRQENLQYIRDSLCAELERILPPQDSNEAVYQQMLTELNAGRMTAETGRKRFYEDLTDYYTMWVHQIKTPIAAMRLLLREDEEGNRAELSELFKIEEYVEMVLGYLRTGDMSADMDFGQYSLDGIIRGQIHKFARIFVSKKLSLEYDGTGETVLTDKKWLGFVIGQLLSNALKYTKSGKVSIYMSQSRPHTLVIADTGIGIAARDLPRVFEKGFTGENGREETRSTGIGLYLCAKIMKKLRHGLTIQSEPGRGTEVYLALGRREQELY